MKFPLTHGAESNKLFSQETDLLLLRFEILNLEISHFEKS